MARELKDMIVVITGASAGIGRALAQTLHAAGARLVLSARRADKLDDLNRELAGQHLVVPADVSVEADCHRLIQLTVARFGRIDTLVCNAGFGLVRRAHETSRPDMQRIFATNVFGTTDCIAAAVPVMLGQPPRDGCRGHIVIVSSAAARRGLPYFGAYSATKAAQLSIAESLRVELKPRAIAVTSVHPVGTATDFFTTAEQLSGRRIPPRTPIEPRQSAELVARKIAAAIRRPRREVWPHRPMRWLTNLGILFPASADYVMTTHRRALAAANDS